MKKEYKIEKYFNGDNFIDVIIDYDNINVWIPQKNIAQLYNKSIKTINGHIKTLFSGKSSVILKNKNTEKIFEIISNDGKTYNVKHYSLDIVLEIGYKCNVSVATSFKEWVDQLFKVNNNQLLEEKSFNEAINSMIYTIRGEKVMLDYDLAKIYGYETKRFNEQVSNNIDKFPGKYRFQLTKLEASEISRSKKSTAIMQTQGIKGGRTSLPYAFTEQGIYMLMTVLKGELATQQSIILIDTFKQMKDYIIENTNVNSISEILKLTNTVNSLSSEVNKLSNNDERLFEDNNRIKEEIKDINERLQVFIDKFTNPSPDNHIVFKNGDMLKADNAYQQIYSQAKHSIFLIDDYIDIKTLLLIETCNPYFKNIKVIVISDNIANNTIDSNFINMLNKDTKINLSFKKNKKMFHDRYIVIDFQTDNEMIYHCGGSSKDAGKRITEILKMEDTPIYKDLILKVLSNPDLIIK